MTRRTAVSWSSGKDSAWMLHCLQQDTTVDLACLLTTINEAADRVAMHAVRRQLLERQAKAAGLPLVVVGLPWPCTNEVYEARMADALEKLIDEGIEAMAFGDLFLEDVRAYREKQLESIDIEPVFPIWGQATDALAGEMIDAGLEARITCVDPKQLSASFAGRRFDASFLADLPDGVDPCGENGEFHSYCYAGPMFEAPIDIEVGATIERDGFVFTDLTAAEVAPTS